MDHVPRKGEWSDQEDDESEDEGGNQGGERNGTLRFPRIIVDVETFVDRIHRFGFDNEPTENDGECGVCSFIFRAVITFVRTLISL